MIFRTVAFLLALLLIVLLVLYVVTKNKNYLELVKKITRYTITAFFNCRCYLYFYENNASLT